MVGEFSCQIIGYFISVINFPNILENLVTDVTTKHKCVLFSSQRGLGNKVGMPRQFMPQFNAHLEYKQLLQRYKTKGTTYIKNNLLVTSAVRTKT